eukprot:8141047-Pyramimonas_sp.AAC.1
MHELQKRDVTIELLTIEQQHCHCKAQLVGSLIHDCPLKGGAQRLRIAHRGVPEVVPAVGPAVRGPRSRTRPQA